MSIDQPTHNAYEDEVTQLARRVSKARGRLAYQFDPALTLALSEDELHAERELAERIRVQDREQRWKQAQAAASASDRARNTTEQIEKADIRDLLMARRAIAAQRRESSPHAKLASLYRHRAWSLRALAGVVVAGMLWSAVNVQHNIAPGGPGDPLYWFSYLLEGMISVCLIIIMTGTNKVAEWGVVDSRKQVAAAEIALLGLTVTLNIYPYLRASSWYDAAVHAVAPVMIGVSLLIHDAASMRYGLAIVTATEEIRDLPDPAELIRRTWPAIGGYRLMGVPSDVVASGAIAEHATDAEPAALAREAETPMTPAGDAKVSAEPEVAAAANGHEVAAADRAPEEPMTVPLAFENGAATIDVDAPPVSLDAGESRSSSSFSTAIAWQSSDEAMSTTFEDDTEDYAAKVDRALQSVYLDESPDAGRLSDALEQELAELQAARRQARTGRQS